MGRAVSEKTNKVVKSYRMGEDDLNAIKVFMENEECDQSTALRYLIQYGILYYTMNVIDEG